MITLDMLHYASFIEPYRRKLFSKIDFYDEGIVAYDDSPGIYAVAYTNEDIGAMLPLIEGKAKYYLIRGENFANTFLSRHPTYAVEKCYEYVYRGLRFELDLKDMEIRRLDASFLDTVSKYFTLAGKGYVEDRLDDGEMFGLFTSDGTLIGFIGEHPEGSMGMLEVLPEYQRKGYGMFLESYKINEIIDRGGVPYCHVIKGNYASEKLQERLGLDKSPFDAYWITALTRYKKKK